MPIPATSQDIVKGVDFTGAATGTAVEHNQLVDLSVPYTDGANAEEGIGFIITTTDTALNTPSVPDPTTSAYYAKWKRYIWNRRPHASATSFIPKSYMWIGAAANDATLKHWILLDPATFTSIGGGAGTPLQTALDYLNTEIGSANAASTAAQATANVAASNIGTMVGAQTLQQQITTANGSISTLGTKMDEVYTIISGDTTNINASGGINGQLASLQAQLTAGLATYKSVSNITPGSVIGAFIRTNATGAFAEWYDPSVEHYYVSATAASAVTFPKNATTTVTLDAAVSVPAGYYKVSGMLVGMVHHTAGADNLITGVMQLAGVDALSFLPMAVPNNSTNAIYFNGCLTIHGYLSIPKAAGSQAIGVKITLSNNGSPTQFNMVTATTGTYLAITLERLYLAQA